MKLNNIQSKQLLPRFAHKIEWVQNAFDSIVRMVFSRAKSIDAPLTMESIQALTDEELESLYQQYGIAEYYPDLSRQTRDDMLYELCRIYRYLGTPKAVETLVKYIFDGVEIDITVLDNMAFDSHGHLVDDDLIDVFDVKIEPNESVLSDNALARILANVLRFSRNTQTLRNIYFDFQGYFDVDISMGVDPENPCVVTDILQESIAEIPSMNYVVTDSTSGAILSGSQYTIKYSKIGDIIENSPYLNLSPVEHISFDNNGYIITFDS